MREGVLRMPKEELFPREVTTDAPRMTLTGQERLHVEQHKGLVAYQPEEIRFRTACGMLCVAGQGLRFRLYTSSEAIIAGRIDSVGIQPAGGRK